MCLSIMCIMKLVFIVIDCYGIVVKLLRDYCENPVGRLWLLAAHTSTTRCTTVAANRGVSSESKRRGAALKILVYIYIYISNFIKLFKSPCFTMVGQWLFGPWAAVIRATLGLC